MNASYKLFLLIISLRVIPCFAFSLELSPSFIPSVLSETKPFVFSPSDFDISDFSIGSGKSTLKGVEISFEAGSLEWVRTHEVLLVPRGRIRIKAPARSHIAVDYHGYKHFRSGTDEGETVLSIPVALISGEVNPIALQVEKNGVTQNSILLISFEHKGEPSSRFMVDSSCSKWGPLQSKVELSPTEYMYLGCRLVWMEKEEGYVGSLEVLAFWNGVGRVVKINELDTRQTVDSLWALRIDAPTRVLKLQSEKSTVNLNVRLPHRLHLGFVGMGLGPYQYLSQPTGDVDRGNLDTYTAVATIYASLFLKEDFRFVSFSALPIHKRMFVDTGFYLLIQQTQVLDRRLTLNILLGGHFLSFKYNNELHVRPSFPQGFEVIFSDFPGRNQYLSAGAFLYPLIRGRSYFNMWARWGRPGLFAEINYLGFQEPTSGGSAKAEVLGLSIGFPLFQFL